MKYCYTENLKTATTYRIPIKDKVTKKNTTTDSCPVCKGNLEYVSVIEGPKGVSQIFRCVSCGVAVFR